MAIKRSTIAREIRRVTVTFEGTDDTLNVWYRPNDLSPNMQRRMRELQLAQQEKLRQIEAGELKPEEADLTDDTVRMMLEFCERWDLLDEPEYEGAGESVAALNEENLSGLGYMTLGRIVELIMEDIRPNSRKSRPSVNGSARTVSEENVRIGSLSS